MLKCEKMCILELMKHGISLERYIGNYFRSSSKQREIVWKKWYMLGPKGRHDLSLGVLSSKGIVWSIE